MPSMAEFTCPLTNGPSVRYVIKKTCLFFIWIQWKLVKLYLSMCTKTLPSFHWIRMKNKKVFLMAHWMVRLSVKGRWIQCIMVNTENRLRTYEESRREHQYFSTALYSRAIFFLLALSFTLLFFVLKNSKKNLLSPFWALRGK